MGVKERRELEKEQRRGLILDAARSLLLTIGMNEISVNKIAKEAELGVGTIYFYYKSKEEIFAELQIEGLEILHKIINKISTEKNSLSKMLMEIGEAYYKFSEDEKDYYDIINYFISSSDVVFSPVIKAGIDSTGNKTLMVIEKVIIRGIKEKEFKHVNEKEFAIMFWGMLHGLVQFKKIEKTILLGHNHKEVFTNSLKYLVNSLKS
jgi:AcrR family transcriptional regulator